MQPTGRVSGRPTKGIPPLRYGMHITPTATTGIPHEDAQSPPFHGFDRSLPTTTATSPGFIEHAEENVVRPLEEPSLSECEGILAESIRRLREVNEGFAGRRAQLDEIVRLAAGNSHNLSLVMQPGHVNAVDAQRSGVRRTQSLPPIQQHATGLLVDVSDPFTSYADAAAFAFDDPFNVHPTAMRPATVPPPSDDLRDVMLAGVQHAVARRASQGIAQFDAAYIASIRGATVHGSNGAAYTHCNIAHADAPHCVTEQRIAEHNAAAFGAAPCGAVVNTAAQVAAAHWATTHHGASAHTGARAAFGPASSACGTVPHGIATYDAAAFDAIAPGVAARDAAHLGSAFGPAIDSAAAQEAAAQDAFVRATAQDAFVRAAAQGAAAHAAAKDAAARAAAHTAAQGIAAHEGGAFSIPTYADYSAAYGVASYAATRSAQDTDRRAAAPGAAVHSDAENAAAQSAAAHAVAQNTAAHAAAQGAAAYAAAQGAAAYAAARGAVTHTAAEGVATHKGGTFRNAVYVDYSAAHDAHYADAHAVTQNTAARAAAQGSADYAAAQGAAAYAAARGAATHAAAQGVAAHEGCTFGNAAYIDYNASNNVASYDAATRNAVMQDTAARAAAVAQDTAARAAAQNAAERAAAQDAAARAAAQDAAARAAAQDAAALASAQDAATRASAQGAAAYATAQGAAAYAAAQGVAAHNGCTLGNAAYIDYNASNNVASYDAATRNAVMQDTAARAAAVAQDTAARAAAQGAAARATTQGIAAHGGGQFRNAAMQDTAARAAAVEQDAVAHAAAQNAAERAAAQDAAARATAQNFAALAATQDAATRASAQGAAARATAQGIAAHGGGQFGHAAYIDYNASYDATTRNAVMQDTAARAAAVAQDAVARAAAQNAAERAAAQVAATRAAAQDAAALAAATRASAQSAAARGSAQGAYVTADAAEYAFATQGAAAYAPDMYGAVAHGVKLVRFSPTPYPQPSGDGATPFTPYALPIGPSMVTYAQQYSVDRAPTMHVPAALPRPHDHSTLVDEPFWPRPRVIQPHPVPHTAPAINPHAMRSDVGVPGALSYVQQLEATCKQQANELAALRLGSNGVGSQPKASGTIGAPYTYHHNPMNLAATVPMNDARAGSYVAPPARAPEHRRIHDLPSFGGRPEDWPMFANTFYSTTQAFGYTELENHIRLQKCLTGEARRTVESLLISHRHVGQLMTTLESTFGRPDLLVKSQIEIARKLPVVEDASPDQLASFAITVRNLYTFLDCETTQQHMGNPQLLEELIAKLPYQRRHDWGIVAVRIVPHPTIRDLSMWLTEVARVANYIGTQTYASKPATSRDGSNRQYGGRQPSKEKVVMLNQVQPAATVAAGVTCEICALKHDTSQCGEFTKLSVTQRRDEVQRRQLCYGCVRPGHILPGCKDKKKCGVDGCTRWHHRQLHIPDEPVTRSKSGRRNHRAVDGPPPPPTGETANTAAIVVEGAVDQAQRVVGNASSIHHCRDDQAESPVLFRIVPVVLYGRGRKLETYAFLDEGSSSTLIATDVADQLMLEGPSVDINLHWFGQHSALESSRKVSLTISGTASDDRRYNMGNVHTVQDLVLPLQTLDEATLREKYPHLRDVPITGYLHAAPKILIGLDQHHLGVPLRLESIEGGVTAARTRLGWVIYGCDSNRPVPHRILTMHHQDEVDNRYQDLDHIVRAYYTTEDFGVKQPVARIESDELSRARSILDSTTTRVGERFETGLLWRHDEIELPDSFDMAMRRLVSVESKMRRDPSYAAQYNTQMSDYVAKGYARKLSPEEAQRRDGRTWYLPHFAVKNPNKPGKFRMVFDAAAVVRGVSLNSMLLSGPDENVPLTKLLFRFRLGVVGICGDIREMFHQVRIRPADQNSQRFLWRGGDATAPPDVFAMEVMTFGATCSPASAQHVKNTNALEFAEQLPAAVDAILTRHYVDDFVASYSSPEEAVSVTAAVVEVHRRGGFELRGLVCNNRSVLSALGVGVDHEQTVSLEPDAPTEKILGMSWDTTEDAFLFRTRFARVCADVVSGARRPTKREVLSISMSVFDPFGLLSDFMLTAKIITQDLWRHGTRWDEQIPDSVYKRWHAWRGQIERTRLLRVPRCYSPRIRTSSDLQLHVFADASEVAFAAVAYWRVCCDGEADVVFVAGKTKCAPMKVLSVPRLELQAAVLATRLGESIRKCHDELIVNRTVMWTDSQTVLQWIRSDQRKYKPFVAFRVAEITESAAAAWWRWCPTSMNVADDATREPNTPRFDPESRWIRGPEWLRGNEESWPIQPKHATDDACPDEVRQHFVGYMVLGAVIDFGRFSKYFRLCRTVAYMLRFADNTRATVRGQSRCRGELSVCEIERAVIAICRIVQQDAFSPEHAALRGGHQVAEGSDIFNTMPYLDDDGVMRAHGRADAADEEHLPRDAKRPILLPKNHRFTELLVIHHHEHMAHQLEDATISAVRQRFWVPQLRVLVRSVRQRCQACKLRTVRPTIPILGQLPADRLTPYVRPFTYTGLDYFGPVTVTIGRRHEKRWVALFTCLAVRAVHLEIAADLSTDACLVCIRNLCNLRGIPSRIRCDNGTNFVGARNELTREEFFDTEAMKRELSTNGIEWQFNCPGNPEAGGAWERLVQSVKRVLVVTLTEQAPRVETLRALLLEAANMLNSRPLTHVPVEPSAPDPITPNHFLIGGPNVAMIAGSASSNPVDPRKQWRSCQTLSQQFWKQWIRDYLPELTRRSKHYPEVPPLMVGDLVIICESGQLGGRWVRGRIVSTNTGPDGRVRTAEVRTADGVLRRPATKLALLDVSLPK